MIGYEEDWQEFKRLRNTFLIVIALYVPVCFGVGVISEKLFHTFTPGFITAFFWMALLALTGMRVNLWRCPNCREWFSGTWWYNLSFLARRSVHCGLPKYSNNPPAGKLDRIP